LSRTRNVAPLRSSTRRSAPIFAALGDETRLRLLARLCRDGPQSITRLAADSDITRQAITKHLRRMQAAGVLRASKAGRERVWEVDPASLDEAGQYLRAISEQWDAALARLERFVEA
jgi:DNA-binding transcriptional ArsR family regulator